MKNRKSNVSSIPTPKKNWLQSRIPNKHLSENQKSHKLKQLKNHSLKLKKEVKRLKLVIKKKIKKEGIFVDQQLSDDLSEILANSSLKSDNMNFSII
jgi:hypothetical protein